MEKSDRTTCPTKLFSKRAFAQPRGELLSPFAEVLPKVRRMRESCAWQPSTTPASREQRGERVRSVRPKIAYRGLPRGTGQQADRGNRSVLGYGWTIFLLVLGATLVILVLNSSP